MRTAVSIRKGDNLDLILWWRVGHRAGDLIVQQHLPRTALVGREELDNPIGEGELNLLPRLPAIRYPDLHRRK
ncbi:hypothetical protein FOZ60_009420 [Perkinsus olseni]|uniref:Uncharacterized protein n=1 Tax=Perkinsus olseni TaxID=32597 RepID=A0A7J6PF31_PEROL|nr:hypothetical protein FOZ60_009420 [Perkinsus olseni]